MKSVDQRTRGGVPSAYFLIGARRSGGSLTMRQMQVVALVVLLAGCGGGGSSPTSNTPVVRSTPAPTPTPETRAFGPGQHLLGSGINAGRYFADPVSGCYWERVSGLGGTLGEIIANDFVGFDAAQIIVDVLASDRAFVPDTECGNWYTTPRQGAQTTIRPGTWLVETQVQPGTYTANITPGCYWERLRDFEGRISSIIANDFINEAGPRSVEIRPGDVGFNTDGDCGTWARGAGVVVEAAALQPRSIIQAHRDLQRAQEGIHRR